MARKKRNSPSKTDKICLWIADQDIPKKSLAKRMKLSWNVMYHIQNGYIPSLRIAKRFADYTGNIITLDDLGWKIERKENI